MSHAGKITNGLLGGSVFLLIVLFVAVGGRLGYSGSKDDASENQRRSALRGIAQAYFNGLGKRDLSKFPYDANVSLRAPLNPKGGSDSPIVGRDNVLAYFAKVLPAIASVSVRDTYVNEALTIVCAEATVRRRHLGDQHRPARRGLLHGE